MINLLMRDEMSSSGSPFVWSAREYAKTAARDRAGERQDRELQACGAAAGMSDNDFLAVIKK